MKKIALTFSILATSVVFLFTGCKPTPRTAPVADVETESALEVSHALFTLTDAEMMVSFYIEGSKMPLFYIPATDSAGLITDYNQTSYRVAYKTGGAPQYLCVDGHTRKQGSAVFMQPVLDPAISPNPHATPNSGYPRMYGFGAFLSFGEYIVDNWKLVNTNNQFKTYDGFSSGGNDYNLQVINHDLPDSKYDKNVPWKGEIAWTIKGHFKLVKIDPNNNDAPVDSVMCHINMTKQIVPTGTPSLDLIVYSSNSLTPISWSTSSVQATVGYYGTITGVTTKGKEFSYEVTKDRMIMRKFSCYPNKVAGINVAPSGSVTTKAEEFHPFVMGVASFTPNVAITDQDNANYTYPRLIYYSGSEDVYQCDNSGAILIKGISYPVDFRK